jgi:para-nitrobenzyl esterase
MNSLCRSSSTFLFAIAGLACLFASACGHSANSGAARGADGVQRAETNATPAASPHTLAGTSWRFVRFQSSDESIVLPKDPAEYTLAFADGGKVSARIACNRGFGSWKSEAPGQLTLGPLALSRAMCPPDPFQDRLIKDWSAVRSYVQKDGRLYLALMADGGIYELEPVSK